MSQYTSYGISNLKQELVGHTTLCVLSLLGFALYSLTYSIVYASSSATPVVATLEMWMVSTHLILSILSTCIQGIGVSILRIREPLPHVAAAQTSVYLGIAIVTTYMGIMCVQQQTGSNFFHCSAFYGAAAVPQLSAVGTFAWAWVMYVSSLGCQTWNGGVGGGFTLGLTDFGCLCVSSVLILTPMSIINKLYFTCDSVHGFRVLKTFCQNDTSILCGGVWLPTLFVFFGLGLYGTGYILEANTTRSGFILFGMLFRVLGVLLFVVCSMIYISVANSGSSIYSTNMLIVIVLCGFAIFDNLVYKKWRVGSSNGSTSVSNSSRAGNSFLLKSTGATASNLPLFRMTRVPRTTSNRGSELPREPLHSSIYSRTGFF
jgi:hypothetical protein